jgi:very-short-patch-repair endonuclease
LCLEITLKDFSGLVEETVKNMALAAKVIWPDWYLFLPDAVWGTLGFEWADDTSRLKAAPKIVRGIDKRWLSEATRAISERDLSPYFPKLILEIQANQLSLALSGAFNRLHILVPPEIPPEAAPVSLVKGLEWLARETQFEVTVFLPSHMAVLQPFSPLVYNAGRDQGEDGPSEFSPAGRASGKVGQSDPEPAGGPQSEAVPPAQTTAPMATPGNPEPPTRTEERGRDNYELQPQDALEAREKFPEPVAAQSGSHGPGGKSESPLAQQWQPGNSIVGLPNPSSFIEKKLAKYLSLDQRLKGLFLSNQQISARGKVFIVDFYWPGGGVVIETDGYRFHKSFKSFYNDRLRDFCLTVSGKTVLRLTGYDIVYDISGSLDKIWEMVTFVANRYGLSMDDLTLPN